MSEKKLSHDHLQSNCWKWAWSHFPDCRRLFFAIANGGLRDKITATRLLATGVIGGPHDMILFWKGQFFTFEFKVGADQLSVDKIVGGHKRFGQYEFLVEVSKHGGKSFVVRDENFFRNTFTAIMLGELTTRYDG